MPTHEEDFPTIHEGAETNCGKARQAALSIYFHQSPASGLVWEMKEINILYRMPQEFVIM